MLWSSVYKNTPVLSSMSDSNTRDVLQVFGGDLFNVRFWIWNGLKMIGPQTQCRSQCWVRPFSTAEWHSHDQRSYFDLPPGQSQLQICLMNPNIIFVNPQQRISVLWILHVCSQQIKAICQFRTLDNISLRVWAMKSFCWRGETGDSCRVLQVKQALAKTVFADQKYNLLNR